MTIIIAMITRHSKSHIVLNSSLFCRQDWLKGPHLSMRLSVRTGLLRNFGISKSERWYDCWNIRERMAKLYSIVVEMLLDWFLFCFIFHWNCLCLTMLWLSFFVLWNLIEELHLCSAHWEKTLLGEKSPSISKNRSIDLSHWPSPSPQKKMEDFEHTSFCSYKFRKSPPPSAFDP